MNDATDLYVATANGVLGVRDGEARPLGLEGKGLVRWLEIDRAEPDRLYAATDGDGVWRSDDRGRSWSERNAGLRYKHAFCLAQHPGTGDLYVGTEPAAVFRSADGGDTWSEFDSLRRLPERKDWTFPGPPYIPHVKCLGLSASDADVIFGAVEEGWLIRSRDGGASWDNIKDGTEFDSHTVTVLPDDPAIVVSTSGQGAWRSTDGGRSYARSDDGIAYRYLTHIAVHRDRPRTLFTAGTEVRPPHWRRPGGPGAHFYRSEDAGASWRRLGGGLPDRIDAAPRAVAGHPGDPDTVFIGLDDGAIWMSDDGGDRFRKIIDGLPSVLGIRAAAR